MIRDCLAKIGCLAVVALVLGSAWLLRDEIGKLWRDARPPEPRVPSEAVAVRAEGDLAALEAGRVDEVRLDVTELQSLLTYRIAAGLPAGVDDPAAGIRDSALVLSARLDLDRLEPRATAEALRPLLPDSARVTVEMVPGLLRPGVARLRIRGLRAGALLVPGPLLPFLLDGLEIPGAEVSGTLLFVPAPLGVRHVRIEGEELVLSTRPPPAAESAGEGDGGTGAPGERPS